MLFPLLALLFTLPLSGHSEPVCIAGDPKDRRLVDIFYDTKNPDNGPIAMWRRERPSVPLPKTENSECRDCKQPYFDAISDLVRMVQRGWTSNSAIDKECVESAMTGASKGVMKVHTFPPAVKFVSAGGGKTRKVPIDPPHGDCQKIGDKYKCATQAFICDRAKSQPKTKAGAMPCLTADMAEYLTWITNQALTCLSREDDPIDRRVIFRKLNNESQFLFAVKNRNGMCTQQLIDVAIREMLAPSRGYGEILQPINDLLKDKNPKDPARQRACRTFADVLKRENTPPMEIGEGRHALKSCDFLQPGIGMARCALIGVGYFAHVSYTYKTARAGVMTNISADAVVKRAGLNPLRDAVARDLRDHIALAAYSSAGPGGASDVFVDTARALGCPGERCTSTNLLRAFVGNMSAYYDRDGRKVGAKPKPGRDVLPNYYRAIDSRLRSLFRKMDKIKPNEKDGYSDVDLKGGRCVR